MKTQIAYYLLLLSVLCLQFNCSEPSSDSTDKQMSNVVLAKDMGNTASSEALHTAMRRLWEDHIIWTRNVVFCIADNLPGTEEAVNRLMKNQDDIGRVIKLYYGADAGNKITALLHQHITVATEVIKAAKANNKPMLDNANARWTANADSIAAFLSSANPNLQFSDVKEMMKKHLQLTTDEAIARIKKDYNNDRDAFEKVHGEILSMADMLSDGIVKQFPEKF